LQWPLQGWSDESAAVRQTNSVDLGPCSEGDTDRPSAADTAVNRNRHPQDDHDRQRLQSVAVSAAPTPVSAVRISDRCVLLTFFDGDVASNVDQHFTRSLKTATAAAAATGQEHLAGGDSATLQQQLHRHRVASDHRANSLLRTLQLSSAFSPYIVLGNSHQFPTSHSTGSTSPLVTANAPPVFLLYFSYGPIRTGKISEAMPNKNLRERLSLRVDKGARSDVCK